MGKQKLFDEAKNRIYGDHRSDGSIKKKGIADHLPSMRKAISDEDWNLLEYYRKEMSPKFAETEKILYSLSSHEEVLKLRTEYEALKREMVSLFDTYCR